MAVHASAAMVADAAATLSSVGADDAAMVMATGIVANPFAAVGNAGAIDGVDAVRDVTGVFTPMLTGMDDVPGESSPEERSQRLFFAAIGGRSRGPFTAKEMVTLADKGKVRSGTLVWKAGTSTWQPLRAVTAFDAGWLQDAVKRRKRKEVDAETAALDKAGITPLLLEHKAIRVISDLDIVDVADADVVAAPTGRRRWGLVAAAAVVGIAVAVAATWFA